MVVILGFWRIPASESQYMNMQFNDDIAEVPSVYVELLDSANDSVDVTLEPTVEPYSDQINTYSSIISDTLMSNIDSTTTPVTLLPDDESVIPHTMKGLVGRDPYFEVVNGRVNKRSQITMGKIMKLLGVNWVRIEMRIPLKIGASEKDIETAISRYDYFIETVAPENELKVLMLLSFDVIMEVDPNQLSVGPYISHPVYGANYNIYMSEWMFRAQKVINRYGKKIHAIEVLNEANRLPRYSDSIYNAVPAEVMAQLVTTIYLNCNYFSWKQYCQETPIVMGGLHPRGSVASDLVPARTDMEYLADIYQSNAFMNAYQMINRWPLDAVGYHPYPWELYHIGVMSQQDAFNRLRLQLEKLGDPLRQIWVTEIGYNVAYAQQNEAGQAAFLHHIYHTLAKRKLKDGSSEIPVVFWFKYEDFPDYDGMEPQHWGLVHIPFVPGPCVDKFCYQRNGEPEYYRQAWHTYRNLSNPQK